MHSVFDNLVTNGLMMVGQKYGLSPSDLWRATSRVNQLEIMLLNGSENAEEDSKDEESNSAACSLLIRIH
jgi:hypothetical protein